MAYDEIISFIRSNLNKDFEHDFNYLLKELVHYQSLPNGEQIVKSIVELMKTELGDAGLKKIKEIELKGLKERIDKYNTGIKLLQERKTTEAQEIFVNLIDTFGDLIGSVQSNYQSDASAQIVEAFNKVKAAGPAFQDAINQCSKYLTDTVAPAYEKLESSAKSKVEGIN